MGEQMLASLLFTYFLGAVYDDMIYSKTALCVYMVRWVLLIARDEKDMVEVCYRLCREIEHSDLNLDHLEELFDASMEG